MSKKNKLGRRDALKAMAGIPVLGLFGFEALRGIKYDAQNDARKKIIDELGLDDLLSSVKPITKISGELIRVGIIGFGVRGGHLAKALGYMSKEDYEEELKEGSLDAQIKDGNLNVSLAGICDVFDLHAEKGMAIADHDIFTGGELAKKYPAKRYMNYHDMLADPNIDAVMIATPDHHHARMTIDAVNAGKHVYCEKSPIHREEEIEPLYHAVKESGLVYQMGHQIPQNAVFQQAREIINRGLLGHISQVETATNRNSPTLAWIRHLNNSGKSKRGDEQSIDWEQWLGKAPEVPFSLERFYSWARFFDYDTGLFGQLFSHEFDAVNQLLKLGIPEMVSSTGGQYYYKEIGDMPDVLHTSFEYIKKGITLTYSGNLTSSKVRPRTIYGKDASMTIGESLTMTPDDRSEKYGELLDQGLIDSSRPMLEIAKGASLSKAVDAVSSASVQYYASRGLTTTNIGGQEWDVTHLHVKEWFDCIRNGGVPSANIDMAYQEAVTIAMADISYREQCRTKWDPLNKRILRV